MNQTQNNYNISTLFSNNFKDFATSSTFHETHAELSNFIETLLIEDYLFSNQNSQLGHVSLKNPNSSNPPERLPLSEIFRKLKQNKQTNKQKVFVTLAYQRQMSHMDEGQNEFSLKPGMIQNRQNPLLLIYYRNTFFLVPGYLNQTQNKSFIKVTPSSWQINLEKNILLTSEQIDLYQYNRIIVQPQSYKSNIFSFDSKDLKAQRKYSNFFVQNNPFLKIQNLSYSKTSEKIQTISSKYARMAKQKLLIYKDNAPKQQQLRQFHFLFKNKLQFLAKTWDSSDSDFRIVIAKDSDQPFKRSHDQTFPSLFLYNKFQQFQFSKGQTHFNINLMKKSFFQYDDKDLVDEIRMLKDLLLLGMIYQKNKTQLNRIFKIKQNIQSSLYQSIKSKQQSIEQTRRKRIDKIKSTSSLKKYSSISIQNFFKQWKLTIEKPKSPKIPIISISPNQMYLTTDYKYTKMECKLYITYQRRHKKLNHQSNRSQFRFLKEPFLTSPDSTQPNDNRNVFKQIYTFTFDEDLQDWDVKLVPEDPNSETSYLDNKSQQNIHVKNVCFDLSQVSDLFKIKVIIVPIKSNRRNSSKMASKIEGQCEISKHQKMRMIGEHQEILLKQVGGETVGFLNFFYLIKEYLNVSMAEDFNIHKNQKIQFLQNIGKIPKNYFQTTSINFTPNDIPFFAHLFSTNKHSINQISFENNYIALIDFLIGQKKSQRRDQIMEQERNSFNQSSFSLTSTPNKTFTFPYHQRINQYQKLLGISQLQTSKRLNQISKSHLKQSNQNNQQNLINQYVIYQVPSQLDQISLKTFGLIRQSLKASMNHAQKIYCPEAHLQTLGVLSIIFSLNKSNFQQIKVSIYKNQGSETQGRTEYEKTQNNIKKLQTFNPYLIPIINRIITLFKLRRTQFNDNLSIRSESSVLSEGNQSLNQSKVSQFTINFLSQVYPYFNPKSLQKQSLYIRYFVQKYLPELNFILNRKHIGLENFVSKYLLSFFSMDLEEEITFTIWDFIISCPNKFSARINCILTLLVFMEKTNFHPVVPVSAFAKALSENYQKFDFSNNAKKISERMLESLGELYEKEHKRKSAIYELRDEKGSLLLGNEFVKKVMFDTQRLNRVNFIGNKKVNLNDLSYRLPEPKYYGYGVDQIKLLLRGIFISDTVPLNDWNLVVKWHNMTSQKVSIKQKNQNLNEFIRFRYPKQLKENSYDLADLEFIISARKSQEKCFIGYLPILNLHKDYVYCEQVRLVYVKEEHIHLSNKGQNILHLQLILKSNQSHPGASKPNQTSLQASKHSKLSATVNNINLRLEKEYYLNQQKKLQLVYDRLLDYDLEEDSNQALKEIKRLKMVFNKMKNPIDQFSHEKYDKLKIPSLGDTTFPEVVMNSELLIEHLQALIDQTFPDSKSLKLNLPQIYKIFSKNTNYQMIFLTQILIEAILIDKTIIFQQKIQYLYCLGKHYQNTGGTGLTVQTVDFIFSYIFKTYAWLNAVPYTSSGKGHILQGVIYAKGIKLNEEGLDITNILRDWAHICKIKYGHLDLVLGDAIFLTSLRSLLPVQTLQSLQNSNNAKELRIEIIYQKNQSNYIWSACVDIKDFRVKQVGTKFLDRYPPQAELHSGTVINHQPTCSNLNSLCWNENVCKGCKSEVVDLDTASEILYNCNNLISLEQSSTINRAAFNKILYTNPLLCYLLHYSSVYEPIQFAPGKPLISKPYQEKQQQENTNLFKDWILYRYQNCISQWRKCNIYMTQGQITYVQMPDNVKNIQKQVLSILSQKYKLKNVSDMILYKAPNFQVWSMDQNLVDQSLTEKSQKTDERNAKSQRQAMRRITKKK